MRISQKLWQSFLFDLMHFDRTVVHTLQCQCRVIVHTFFPEKKTEDNLYIDFS